MAKNQKPQNQLLREAAEWRLLSTLFSKPGTEWRREVGTAAREVSDPKLREACSEALRQAAEGLYHSLFGPGGPAAPREASYRTTLQLGYLLSELETYYDSFGYVPSGGETPDHIAVETDFAAYLRLKQALALELNQPDKAEVTARASKEFHENHLSFVAEPLHRSLANSGIPYLELASQALFERVGPSMSTQTQPKDLAEDLITIQDATFSCGS